MRNKISQEYENKRWYRIVKVSYIFLFVLFLAIGNLLIFTDSYNDNKFWSFVITNVIIVFSMGTIEGLFWYIVRGKWGYPKEDESNNLEIPKE